MNKRKTPIISGDRLLFRVCCGGRGIGDRDMEKQ